MKNKIPNIVHFPSNIPLSIDVITRQQITVSIFAPPQEKFLSKLKDNEIVNQ